MSLLNNPLRKVVIFRNELLPRSETFILAQTSALKTYIPVFAAVHAAPNSLQLPTAPILVDKSSSTTGKVLRRLYWQTSIAPGFHRQLKAKNPDLIHAHFALDGAAAVPLQSKLKIPLVVTLHGYDVTSSDASLAGSIEGRTYLRRRRLLWQQASVFLCISEFIRDQALERGFPRHKLRVHYTGTDLKMFQYKNLPRDRNQILFVARLVEKKGCEDLLDAVAAIRQQYPTVKLTVIGSGPLEAKLKSKALAENLSCEFLGSQPTSVVRDQMAKARVFCVPSLTASNGDSEGLGMVFVEAQAMGTPVVSYRHGGLPEVVNHEQTGLLAPERDKQALGMYLLRLLREDKIWNDYSQNAVGWAVGRFDIEHQTALLEDIYSEVIAQYR